MRLALKIVLGALLGGAGLLVLIVVGSAVFVPNYDCSSTSPAVARARALSQEELAALYAEMAELSSKEKLSPWFASVSLVDELPKRVAMLEPQKVRFDRPSIVLEGCFDHSVIMYFNGIPATKLARHEPGIDLQWGEFEPESGHEQLWAP